MNEEIYNVDCVGCGKEVTEERAVRIEHERDEERLWYNYFCTDKCAEEFFKQDPL